MTMPHLMNCGHRDDAHCLDCVKAAGEERESLRAQLATAQAELARVAAERDGARAEIDSLQTESEYLFQLLSPENKTAYLERLGISRERQDAAWKRVKDALEAASHPTPEGKP